jgi:cytochrome c oxidase assembly protein subunit 15
VTRDPVVLLTQFALLLALMVVMLGAFTRLSHAGLSCPDWPGCYGSLIVPDADRRPEAELRDSDRPLHVAKAWKEMIHRYAAGLLGLVILALAMLAVRRAHSWRGSAVLPALLLALVILQALLGMWTVTWLLKPAVVVLHLLGGFAILGLLFWQVLDHAGAVRATPQLRGAALAALAVLVVQITLGGWTSANYAALACPEFPSCAGGSWWPEADFREAFVLWRGVGADYEGGVLDAAGRIAVQLAHRVGALATLLIVGATALICLWTAARRTGAVIAALLCLQIGLGAANVLLRIPLPIAVAHNAVAALLLLSLVRLLHLSASRFPEPRS